jgi:FkbM family methyltransferase
MKKLEIVKQAYDWTDRTEWLAPENDWSTPIHCRLVTDEIDWVMKYVDWKDTCIQAGGNIGLWPACYAKEFEHVITFEPADDSFACMKSNLAELENVQMYHAAVGHTNLSMTLKHPPNKKDRSGACYVEPDKSGAIPQLRVDDIELPGCVDLIHFDIEGRELHALRGAAQVINEQNPVIVLENRYLAHMQVNPLAAVDWLKRRGYKIVAQRQHDILLKWK